MKDLNPLSTIELTWEYDLFGLFFGIVVGRSIALLLLSAHALHGSIRCSLITDELCVLSVGLDCICRTLYVFLGLVSLS